MNRIIKRKRWKNKQIYNKTNKWNNEHQNKQWIKITYKKQWNNSKTRQWNNE